MKASKFSRQELQKHYDNDEVIFITHSGVFNLHYSRNAGFSFTKIRVLDGWLKPGTHTAMTPTLAIQLLRDK